MFGKDVVSELGIKYCHRAAVNTNPVIVGLSQDLMCYLMENPDFV